MSRRRFPAVALVVPLLARSWADPRCVDWAAAGECSSNPVFMLASCPEACRKVYCDERGAMYECETAPHTMGVVCPGTCRAPDRPPRCPRGFECNAAALRDETSDPKRLGRCVGWAESGECESNTNYMRSKCPLSCAERSAAECATWARAGECGENAEWMRKACSAACASARRETCSAAECAGQPEACPAADGSGGEEARRRTMRWPAPRVSRLGNTSAQLTVRNDLSAAAQLFYAPPTATETGYGVLAPGARQAQHACVGDRWRFRALALRGAAPSSGALLGEVVVGVASVHPCLCAAHARDASVFEPAPSSANASALLLVLSGVSVEATALRWNGSAHVVLGSLWPSGSRRAPPRASSQLLLRDLHEGDLVSVVVASELWKLSGGAAVADSAALRSALLMQHLQTDLVLTPCPRELSAPPRTHLPALADEAAARAAQGRHERRLERELRGLEQEREALRAELGRLQELGAVGSLPSEVAEAYASRATELLAGLGKDGRAAGGRPGAAAASSSMRARGKRAPPRERREHRAGTATPRAVRRSSSAEHDELRLRRRTI